MTAHTRPRRAGLIAALSAVAVTALMATAVTAAAAPAATAGTTAKTVTTAKTLTTAKTVTAQAAAPGSAARAAALAYKAPARNLAPGMTGADVKALQRRLAALKYYPGAINGEFGSDTQAALWAFQEVNRVRVSGVADAATKRALVHPRTYKSPSYAGRHATRIEVNQALEVLVLFDHNKIMLISHVSSGGGYYYDGGARAVTPNGTYYTTEYLPGWVAVPLGEMWNPVFFVGTVFAIHGDTYVPAGPASHGCVRIPMDIAAFFHRMVKTPGTQVHVYGTAQWES
jgi:peptidoglycan hydrolase-like protein with peptidoglycan-binding domain